MTEMDKMRAHEFYNCDCEEIRLAVERCKDLCYEFNHLRPSNRQERQRIIRELFASVGDHPWMEAPIQVDIGELTHIGDRFYANHNLIMLDAGGITIGNDVRIGPNCGIYCPQHAFDPELRNAGYERSLPVTIEDNVWICGSVSVLGGVTIGKNSVIGAGSVVTRDIPANVLAAGNPCRVIRELTEEEMKKRSPQV